RYPPPRTYARPTKRKARKCPVSKSRLRDAREPRGASKRGVARNLGRKNRLEARPASLNLADQLAVACQSQSRRLLIQATAKDDCAARSWNGRAGTWKRQLTVRACVTHLRKISLTSAL